MVRSLPSFVPPLSRQQNSSFTQPGLSDAQNNYAMSLHNGVGASINLKAQNRISNLRLIKEKLFLNSIMQFVCKEVKLLQLI
jgi:hypothetical protein